MLLKNTIIISIVVVIVIIGGSIGLFYGLKQDSSEDIESTVTPTIAPTSTPSVDNLPTPLFHVESIITSLQSYVSITFDSDSSQGISVQQPSLIHFWNLDVDGNPQINTDITIVSPSNFVASTQTQTKMFTHNNDFFALVSGFTDNTNRKGIIFTYKYFTDQKSWDVVNELTIPFSSDNNNQFGTQIQLNFINDEIILSASSSIGTLENSGAVYIFKFNGLIWVFQNQIIEMEVIELDFGSCLSGQGTSLVICSRGTGIIRYYEWTGSLFYFVQELTDTGDQCLLSYNGKLIVSLHNNIIIYELLNGSFNRQSNKIQDSLINTLTGSQYTQYIVTSQNTNAVILNRIDNNIDSKQLIDVRLQPTSLDCLCNDGDCLCQNQTISSVVIYDTYSFILCFDMKSPTNMIVYKMTF
jgi:hypothetical protein